MLDHYTATMDTQEGAIEAFRGGQVVWGLDSRHTFAVSVIEADVALPALQGMGGWKHLPWTYLATLGDRAAKAAHQRVSPADGLAGKR